MSHTGPLLKKKKKKKKTQCYKCFDSFKLELGVFMYKHQTNSLPQTFSEVLLNIAKSITILQEIPKIRPTVFIKPNKFLLIEQYE